MGSTIGRPRRFSSSFVKSERVKLREYRQNVRAIQSDQLADADNFPYEVKPIVSNLCADNSLTVVSCRCSRQSLLVTALPLIMRSLAFLSVVKF